MQEADLLVFDLDGTLIRSGEDLADSVNYALKGVGLPTVTLEAVHGFIGDGVHILMKRAMGPDALEHYDRAMELFLDYYEEHLLDRTTLYPDVPEVLDHFDGKKMVIVTQKLQRSALRIVDALGIADRFQEIIGQDSAPFRKPDPRLLELIMAKWGGTPERTVVIGDGENDILLGRNAGAVSCAFLNGITGRDKLLALTPDLTCEKLSDLKTMIC